MSNGNERVEFTGNGRFLQRHSMEIDRTGVRVRLGGREIGLAFTDVRGLRWHSTKMVRVMLPLPVPLTQTNVEVQIECPGFTRKRPLALRHGQAFASGSNPVFIKMREAFEILARATFHTRVERILSCLQEHGEFRYAGTTITLDGRLIAGWKTIQLYGSSAQMIGRGKSLRVQSGDRPGRDGRIDLRLSWDPDVIVHLLGRMAATDPERKISDPPSA